MNKLAPVWIVDSRSLISNDVIEELHISVMIVEKVQQFE